MNVTNLGGYQAIVAELKALNLTVPEGVPGVLTLAAEVMAAERVRHEQDNQAKVPSRAVVDEASALVAPSDETKEKVRQVRAKKH